MTQQKLWHSFRHMHPEIFIYGQACKIAEINKKKKLTETNALVYINNYQQQQI